MTVPTERWDKNRQRIKVLGSLHRDERTRLMGLNKRIEHHVKAIQDAVHTLPYGTDVAFMSPGWHQNGRPSESMDVGMAGPFPPPPLPPGASLNTRSRPLPRMMSSTPRPMYWGTM